MSASNEPSRPTDAQEKRKQPWGLRLFCLIVFAAPVLAVVAAVPLVRSNWFIRRAVPNYLAMMDDEFSIRNKPCDVLLFGDSSALTGLMPWVIQQDTGATTCSVAQTKGVVGVTGLSFLRQYLSRNPAPRVLVIALAPGDWQPTQDWIEVSYFDGMMEIVRHESFWSIFHKFVSHPNEVFGFTTFIYKSAIGEVFHGIRGTEGPQPVIREGFMTLPEPPQRACAAESTLGETTGARPLRDYVRGVRAEFTPLAGSLILASPPIPDCDVMLGIYSRILDPVLDWPINTEPIAGFNDIDRHFSPQGAEVFSHRIAVIIEQRLQAQKRLGAQPGHAI